MACLCLGGLYRHGMPAHIMVWLHMACLHMACIHMACIHMAWLCMQCDGYRSSRCREVCLLQVALRDEVGDRARQRAVNAGAASALVALLSRMALGLGTRGRARGRAMGRARGRARGSARGEARCRARARPR